jgi:DnaJ-domain-containing protein 1
VQTVLVLSSDWLFLGTFFGVVLSLAVASVFALGSYFIPNRVTSGEGKSGDARRRTEIHQYLQAIDESFAEDHFIEGHTVAFYLPKRDVAITFDARAFYAIERSPTHAVLVEHEMPGIHLGSRLPFETPDMNLQHTDGYDVNPSEAALAVLGLPSNATEQQIKEAYREKVKTVHPDMGGDPESFKQVNEAYATAREHAD